MAKYYLGSVGKAEAFRKNDDGTMSLAFVSKTLTDSGLNISTTKDDIRAGQGAPVQFSFYHDPSVEITLTDVLWKKEYLEAQLGAKFTNSSQDYKTTVVTFTKGEADFQETVYKMPFPCGEDYLVWGAPQGSDEWVTLTYDAAEKKLKVTDSDGAVITTANGAYCVRYLGAVTNAMKAEITSMIVPEELYLVITAPIFAGDACAASRGKAAGHITFDVPRFVLNGAQEFSMNMSSNQTMSLAGTALASESAECDSQGGKLLDIIEVIDNRNWLDDVESITLDDESAEVGNTPSVYGVLKDGHLAKIDNAKLTFTPELTADKFAAGSYTIALTGYDSVPTISVTIS